MDKRITLADIAKKAGYHPTTISMALRNHPRLPASTTEKIKALAEEMGYRPDPALGALVAYRRNTSPKQQAAPLAYLTNWHNEFGWKNSTPHRNFYEGALSRAKQLGYKIDHFWLGEPGLSHERINDILQARGIRGLIIASHQIGVDREPRIQWDQFSSVKIDFFPTSLHVHTISNDQRAIIQLAFRKALDAGYKRIGFVIPRWWDTYVNYAWSAGFLASQLLVPEEDRIPIKIFDTEPDAEIGMPVTEFETWRNEHKPDVIISYNEFVQHAFKLLQIQTPEDFAYIDVCPESKDNDHAGVYNNCERVGELSVEILAGQLQRNQVGLPNYPTVTKVEGTWIDGPSLPTSKLEATLSDTA
ncbi:LacI family DNA-binding transcriptional regulator [Pelagicoccus mobilis]|uniref:LacI family DNA-binding transcriptional regulator n=1 Tax=Pelagicoccus mobilis TaxID=415221 RepID=A0A934RZK6_9BACT|nr:LacI family DNA-binding transcriptional regulator [Pelagicoccus mobilis]MBK1877786.1 LacI family DNA-binding transcriptional regulator [Pelagicoccus mobilis]